MSDLPKYHLIQRKRRKEVALYAGIPKTTPGPGRYEKMIRLKTAAATKGPQDFRRRDREAEVELRELHAAGKLVPSSRLADYLKDFWTFDTSPYVKARRQEGRTISEAYCTNNLHWIERYFLPYMEHRKVESLADLDRKLLLDWRIHLADNGRIKLPGEVLETDDKGNPIEPATISYSTVNKVRQAVHVALEHAVETGMIPFNPMASVRRVKETPKERGAFETHELAKLFSEPWDDIRSYAGAMLAASTGLRLGEVRGLLVGNVHFRDGYLDVVTNYVDGEGLKAPKWEKVRRGVPVPRYAILAVIAMMRTNPWKRFKPTDYVFYGDYPGKPIGKHVMTRSLRERCKAVQVPYRDFHSLRHSASSQLIAYGARPDDVQRMLGHSTASMTAQYTHTTDETRRLISEAQNRAWSNRDSDQ